MDLRWLNTAVVLRGVRCPSARSKHRPAPRRRPGHPSRRNWPGEPLADSVYVRGARALHLLREQMGHDAFFAFVQVSMEDNAHSNVTTQLFMDTA